MPLYRKFLPLQAGIASGQAIQDVTYIIIFFSILACSILIFLLERTPFAGMYQKLFWMFGKETKPS
ncbi:MAG: hypothetical protein ACYDDV_03975 [Methanoregula sp.]